ncbi:hypothetical protein BD769DRAFT_261975 [Suillus cothurnatus]|nr:hypothetical protein BD769DRAFT_261975 [Suillus cothurnatus]
MADTDAMDPNLICLEAHFPPCSMKSSVSPIVNSFQVIVIGDISGVTAAGYTLSLPGIFNFNRTKYNASTQGVVSTITQMQFRVATVLVLVLAVKMLRPSTRVNPSMFGTQVIPALSIPCRLLGRFH